MQERDSEGQEYDRRDSGSRFQELLIHFNAENKPYLITIREGDLRLTSLLWSRLEIVIPASGVNVGKFVHLSDESPTFSWHP